MVPSPPTINVWIIEDDGEFVDSLRPHFDRADGVELTESAASARDLDAMLDGGRPWANPDVVLVDYRLPDVSGIDVLRSLRDRFSSAGFVMLTSNDRTATIVGALQAGASGYILKGTPFGEVVRVIREVHSGGMLMPPNVARRVRDHFAAEPRNEVGLTKREIEILQAMAEGLVQKEIADSLTISPHTVDSHLRNIYHKLHVRSGPAAVARAVRMKLFP